jgi:hypothetical protein
MWQAVPESPTSSHSSAGAYDSHAHDDAEFMGAENAY